MTVAGKYASEGQADIAFWCYETLGALPIFIVEGLIRGSQKKPELEKVALDFCHDEQVNPIALARGYAFIGNQEKVEQCLEKYPNLNIHNRYATYFVRKELAVSALLGNQIEYYQEIQKNMEKTKEIAHTLGVTANLLLIQKFLSEITGSDKLEYLFPLIEGFMQGARATECLPFLEGQVHIHSFIGLSPVSNILRSKAIGAAQAGNIEEAQSYLQLMQVKIPAYQSTVALTASKNGYRAGAKQLYGREITQSAVFNGMLFDAAKNGIMDTLPSLVDHGRDVNAILKIRYDRDNDFSAGFSPFWNKISAKCFLGRILDNRIVQFLLPIVESKFGIAVKNDIEAYVEKINLIRTKHKLNYRQATCLVLDSNTDNRMQAWNHALWVTNQALPSVQRAASEETLALPVDVVYRVTQFFAPSTLLLTDKEARELHDISLKPSISV